MSNKKRPGYGRLGPSSSAFHAARTCFFLENISSTGTPRAAAIARMVLIRGAVRPVSIFDIVCRVNGFFPGNNAGSTSAANSSWVKYLSMRISRKLFGAFSNGLFCIFDILFTSSEMGLSCFNSMIIDGTKNSKRILQLFVLIFTFQYGNVKIAINANQFTDKRRAVASSNARSNRPNEI